MILSDYFITFLSYIKRKEKRSLIQKAISFNNQSGIEIGGPSELFRPKGQLPIYVFAKKVNGVNFSNATIWEGQLNQGNNYQYYASKIGYQYIAEASELEFIDSSKFDFALSCHSLEHVANPLKAIYGWKRLLKNDGKLVLVLPNKENTFDNKRPYTTLNHLIDDYNNQVTEADTTHFEEVISLHDFSKDQFIISKEALKSRTENNFNNRAVHHHVFSLELIKSLLEYAGFEVEFQQKAKPFHLITIAKKKL
jgi:SAM-dependent methyltransferase